MGRGRKGKGSRFWDSAHDEVSFLGRPRPWLPPLLARGYQIYYGFDADQPGETASRQIITRHPTIQRLHPSGPDWNVVCTAARK